jgi:hypothetical protein
LQTEPAYAGRAIVDGATAAGPRTIPPMPNWHSTLLLRHPERFSPLRPQSVGMRSLLSLIEQCRELVGDKTRFTNRLTNALRQ